MNIVEDILKECKNCLVQGDFSLLTRRLMDLCEESVVLPETKTRIFTLRKNYLSLEVNGQLSEALSQLNADCSEMVNELSSSPPEVKNNAELSAPILLRAEQVSVQFKKGSKPFHLKPLNVQLCPGEITGVVGENGNGKTTLLRILCGELASDTGTLSYPALGAKENDWYSVKGSIAFIPQRIEKWHGSLLDNLRFFATIHGFTGPENDERIDYILYRLGLDRFRELSWDEISSGYRLRFELAKMLLWKPRLLILDEPLANLDINAQQLLLQDLRFFVHSKAHPMSIILSSQNLHEIEKVADNIIFIRQGETIYNGPQKAFALNRSGNSYEISGDFTYEQIVTAYANDPSYRIENAGTSFIITTGTERNLYHITSSLEQKGLNITYIRDISHSTRKLFHKDI